MKLIKGLALFLILLTTFGVLPYLALVENQGFAQAESLNKRIATIRSDIEKLRRENANLKRQIQALREDPRALEKVAREERGLIRPGEVLFLLTEEAPQPSPEDR